MDVENRTQFVPVFGLEASRAELDAVHHVGVRKRQAFLLSASNEKWPIHLDVVDIDQVLVERSSSDVVRAAQL